MRRRVREFASRLGRKFTKTTGSHSPGEAVVKHRGCVRGPGKVVLRRNAEALPGYRKVLERLRLRGKAAEERFLAPLLMAEQIHPAVGSRVMRIGQKTSCPNALLALVISRALDDEGNALPISFHHADGRVHGKGGGIVIRMPPLIRVREDYLRPLRRKDRPDAMGEMNKVAGHGLVFVPKHLPARVGYTREFESPIQFPLARIPVFLACTEPVRPCIVSIRRGSIRDLDKQRFGKAAQASAKRNTLVVRMGVNGHRPRHERRIVFRSDGAEKQFARARGHVVHQKQPYSFRNSASKTRSLRRWMVLYARSGASPEMHVAFWRGKLADWNVHLDACRAEVYLHRTMIREQKDIRQAAGMSRRIFATKISCLALSCTAPALRAACAVQNAPAIHFNVAEWDRQRTLDAAHHALATRALPIGAFPLPPSAPSGLSANTFYSEALEFWPGKAQGDAYSHQPGHINPGAYTLRQDALVALNGQVSSLVAAWRLTSDARFATAARASLRQWFVAPATRMNAEMHWAGTIPGTHETDGTHFEQAMPLVEIIRAASFLFAESPSATDRSHADDDAEAMRAWCADFVKWMQSSREGELAGLSTDRDAICWTAVAAEMARFTANYALTRECNAMFREKLLRQMSVDGTFPRQLRRARPYAASIFTLDCMAICTETLTTPFDRVWEYQLPDGRGMRSAVAFLFPSLEDKGRWPFVSDTEFFADLPNRQPSLLFAGRAFARPEYLALWQRLRPEPPQKELLREFPIREPALWTARVPE